MLSRGIPDCQVHGLGDCRACAAGDAGTAVRTLGVVVIVAVRLRNAMVMARTCRRILVIQRQALPRAYRQSALKGHCQHQYRGENESDEFQRHVAHLTVPASPRYLTVTLPTIPASKWPGIRQP